MRPALYRAVVAGVAVSGAVLGGEVCAAGEAGVWAVGVSDAVGGVVCGADVESVGAVGAGEAGWDGHAAPP